MKVLLLRFSAMGDVAMLSVVVRGMLEQNPDLEVYLLSRPNFQSLFPYEKTGRFKFIPADVNKDYKGTTGIYNLFTKLSGMGPFDYVLDMHDVLRTWALTTLFTLRGSKILNLNKGRKEKRQLTKKKKTNFRPLKSTLERYAEVCRKAGIEIELSKLGKANLDFIISPAVKEFRGKLAKDLIGIAPFAKHKMKVLPLEKTEYLVKTLSEQKKQILLFGGGAAEIEKLKSFEKHDGVHSVAGKFSLEDELYLMQELKYMVSMDSANMHMAALVGTEVISIWGATHPFAGFTAFGQKPENIIQVGSEKLTCRPCSVYGNKSCWRGDFACMHWIDENKIVEILS